MDTLFEDFWYHLKCQKVPLAKSTDSRYNNAYLGNDVETRDPPMVPAHLQHTLPCYPASRDSSAFAAAGSVAFVTNHLLSRKNNHDDIKNALERLEDQHETMEGSTSQQQKQLRCMVDQANCCLTSECEATQALETRIKKMTETYTSGIGALEEIVDTFYVKVSSDMEHIQYKVSSQTLAAERFLASAVLEAKDVICNIQNSLDEQKHLLAFSIEQQQEGLKQCLTSALAISEATLNFFNDIHQHSLRVVKIIEETQNERTHQLVNFEKLFMDEAVREEEQALEKMAASTSKRVARVSEACRNMQDTSMKQSKRLQLEMCNMQQVSEDATKEVGKYVENVRSHFTMQLLSTNDSKALMESCLHDCSKRVSCSREQWENAQSVLNNISKDNLAEIENIVAEANVNSNYVLYQEFVSASSCMESDYNAGTQNLLEVINDSKMLDRENKKKIDSMTTRWLDQLHSIPEQHGESISSIQTQVEKCFKKYDLVDERTSLTPKKRMIVEPSHASIKEMRTNIIEEKSKNRSKQKQAETKIPNLIHVLFGNCLVKSLIVDHIGKLLNALYLALQVLFNCRPYRKIIKCLVSCVASVIILRCIE